MYALIQHTSPSAKTVLGGSWLYSWGQFLDSQGSMKEQLAQAFLRNLEGLDAHAPWRAFPLRALLTHAPIDVFYEFYKGRAFPY